MQFVLGYEPHEFANSLTAIAEGKVDLAPWLTGTVPVDGVPQAFKDLANPEAARQDPGRPRRLTRTVAAPKLRGA